MKRIGLLCAMATILAVIMIVFAAGTTHAQIVGELWQNQTTAANNATLAQAAGLGTPDAKFNPGAFNFDSDTTGYTPALFLNSPTFYSTSTNFSTPAAGYGPGASLDNTYFYFTGSLYLNSGINSFVVGHDDGLQLNIDGIGLVVNAPGPTSLLETPFNVTAPSAGTYTFELSYGECCGPPADLVWEINQQVVGVPEPATLTLLGFGLIGLVGLRKKLLK